MDYYQWLHKLTVIGYDHDIMIGAHLEEDVKKMFADGLTPEQAIEKIMETV